MCLPFSAVVLPVMWVHIFFVVLYSGLAQTQLNASSQDYPVLNLRKAKQSTQGTITLGTCQIAIERDCSTSDITFFFYSRQNQYAGDQILVGNDPGESNLLNTHFNPLLPTKILIHGYNSDMFLGVLTEIKNQYFLRSNLNIFMVDWGSLAKGPCYPAAVWNSRFVGKCTAKLVERIREAGGDYIHAIGFSLGAHVAGFISNNIQSPKIARITGLDPALPGFATVSKENKLDADDADFVDVIHTNAFLQGAVEETGHVDFYINGGIVQPGCWAQMRFFACSHHRAALYFAESINTRTGFWGWPCPSYLDYLIGRCPPTEPQILMGEYVDKAARGFHLVITNSVSPFAVGRYTGPLIEVLKFRDKVQTISELHSVNAVRSLSSYNVTN